MNGDIQDPPWKNSKYLYTFTREFQYCILEYSNDSYIGLK